MAGTTLDGICSTCENVIDYDGATENYLICGGYCRRAFHINCLNVGVPASFWKTFRAREEFLFFCDNCRQLQRNFISRRNFLEAERNLAGLVEILQTATHDVDVMCRTAVESVNAAVSTINKKISSEARVVNLVSPTKTRFKKKKAKPSPMGSKPPLVTVTAATSGQQLTSTPNNGDDDVFSTPLPSPKPRNPRKGFFGTADAVAQIGVVEEKRFFVISRIDPSTTPEGIRDYIVERTGVEDIRCQLMLPKSRTLSDVDFVSFKIGVTEADYASLMKPDIWPAKVLVRDFVQQNRRRRGGGATGFHKF